MIKTITAIGENNSSMVLNVFGDDNSTDSFILYSSEGLGSLNAQLNVLGGPNDGAVLNSTKLMPRDIKLSLLINPNYGDDEGLAKQQIFNVFAVKKGVKVVVESESRTNYIIGVVESVLNNLHGTIENYEVQIRCPRPYAIAVNKGEFYLGGVTPQFEFPFSNESLEDDLIVFGDLSTVDMCSIDYDGNYNAGITCHISIKGSVTEDIILHNATYKEQMSINVEDLETFVGPLQFGDELILKTSIGEKGLIHKRLNVETNVLNVLGLIPDWIQLRPGVNELFLESDLTVRVFGEFEVLRGEL